tara:strand:+ start:1258 stop:3516 length:2259 start_codon:yes stop_codon:yes gene_type:complete
MAEAQERTPTPEEIKQAIESGQVSVEQLGPETRAVYDAMLAEGGQPENTISSVLKDPYESILGATSGAAESLREGMGIGQEYQTSTGQNIPDPYGGTSLPELAVGGLETAVSFGSGIPAVAGATIAGAYQGLKGYLENKNWYDTMKSATDSMNSVMGNMVYTPRTGAGKDITAVVNSPFMLIDEGTTAAQNFVQSMLGGNVTRTGADPMIVTQFQLAADQIQQYRDRGEVVPQELFDKANSLRDLIGQQGGLGQARVNDKALFAGISTKAFLDFLPDLAGKGRASAIKAKKVKELRQTAKELGVDLTGLPEEQLLALSASTDILTGSQTVVAQRMASMAERLKRREEISSNVAEQLFEAAKSSEAYYPQVQLKLLDQSMGDLLASDIYNFAGLPVAKGRLDEFSALVADTAFDLLDKEGNVINGYVPLNNLHNFRQKLNKDITKMRRGITYESANELDALLGMKNHIDEFIDAQFEADLVSGNAEAITKWKKANSWYVDYKRKFNSSDVVQTIIDRDLTPEQVKNLILGTGKVVGKAEAGASVRKLNDIFGNNSPQMEALRKEIIFNLSTPLLLEDMNVAAFIENVNTLKRNNPTLITELFQGEALKNLQNLQDLARAQLRVAERAGVEKVSRARAPSLSRLIAINIAPGNQQLAKGAAAQQLVRSWFQPLTQKMQQAVGRPDVERQIMSEFYGVDMNRPFMGLGNFPTVGAIQATRRAEEEDTRGETTQRLQGMSQRLREFGAEQQRNSQQ